jgi:hypothetical protein
LSSRPKTKAKQEKQNEKFRATLKKTLTHFQVKMCGNARNISLKAPPMMFNMWPRKIKLDEKYQNMTF